MKYSYLLLLIVGVCTSQSHQDKSPASPQNGTREMRNMYSAKQTDRTSPTAVDSVLTDQQSSTYRQYSGHDDDQVHHIVLSSLNSKIPDPNPIDGRSGDSKSTQAPTAHLKPTSFSQTNQDQKPVQSSGFKPSQFLGYRNAGSNPSPTVTIQNKQPVPILHRVRTRFPAAERRTDEDTQGENNYVSDDDESQYDSRYGLPKPDYEAPEPEYGAPKPEYGNPETRESLHNYFPGSGPSGFVGPAVFDPFPPPPPAIKGSIDYILIPLVLIGLAGPIFVVLYVILGSFEAKLSPITSRSLSESYKPYLDTVMSSVSRALDTNECLDYAACQFGSLCKQVGFTGDELLNQYVKPITPQKYRRHMRKLISSMKDDHECSIKKCLSFK